MKKASSILAILLLGACCHTPKKWTDLPARAFDIPPYAKFVKGLKVCLDPGHGGDAERKGYKRGPTGFREAVMNWRVAAFLKEFLENAGAKVILTRLGDVEVTLKKRADIALAEGADIFVSIHHNAMTGKPGVNYTTIWYHGDCDFSPPSLDLGRCIYWGLTHELRLAQISEVPLHSDYLLYPGTGFGVLRNLKGKIPAVLLESSFFTNPEEEKRLKDPEYNRREAWGIFLGIARWAMHGIPCIRILDKSIAENSILRVKLYSGLEGRKAWPLKFPQILETSINVFVDEERYGNFDFQRNRSVLTIRPPEKGWKPGRHKLFVRFVNSFKNDPVSPVCFFHVKGENPYSPSGSSKEDY